MEITLEGIVALITLFIGGSGIGGLLTWRWLKKKAKAEAEKEEQGYYRRGKNTHTHANPKSCTKQEYAKATGLETLFGALYLLGRTERLNQLFHIIITEE